MSTGEHETDALTTVETDDGTEKAAEPKRKLDLEVEISDVGPCKKHLKVAIARSEIDRQFDDSLKEMKREAFVPGFRPGHAPRQLVEKRYKKQVAEQVKSTLLMSTLEQLDADHNLNPIAQPQLDVDAITLPDEGPMLFEMDVEVRPDFAAPAYKALTVKRPVKTIGDADVEAQFTAFLERYAPRAEARRRGRPRGLRDGRPVLPPRRQAAERGERGPVPPPAGASVPGRVRPPRRRSAPGRDARGEA